MKSQSLKIRLNANISSVLDTTAKSIVKLAKKSGCKVSGPVPLPTNICRITVNKSPHVDKKSREQFEIRDLARLIVIHHPSTELIKNLSSFHLPSGVAFKIVSGEEFKIDKKKDTDLSSDSLKKNLDQENASTKSVRSNTKKQVAKEQKNLNKNSEKLDSYNKKPKEVKNKNISSTKEGANKKSTNEEK